MIVNWQAIAALLVSIGGLATHPQFLNVLPPWASLTLTVVGLVGQAFTQQIARVPVSRQED